jgi:putative hydrolase of the HAD superfamily
MMPVVVVFDLDDTLYKEIDYLKSAFHYIAALVAREEGGEPVGIYERMVCNFYQGLNVFQLLIDSDAPGFSMDRLLKEYRTHRPQISLDVDTMLTLSVLRHHEVVLGGLLMGEALAVK